MSNIDIVRLDDGEVNVRIIAKETKTDFRRVEASSLKMPTRFVSAVGKRYYVRLFNTLQLNAHFVSVIAPTKLDPHEVEQVELAIRAHIDKTADLLNRNIDNVEALFHANGITKVSTYDTLPLDVEAAVLSAHGRRYLEVLIKLDQLMPMLETLVIHEVITARELDVQRAKIKREVRNVANGARHFAAGLRRRMNAKDAAAHASAPSQIASTPDRTEQSQATSLINADAAGLIDQPIAAALDPS